jgi:hypothetical protein
LWDDDSVALFKNIEHIMSNCLIVSYFQEEFPRINKKKLAMAFNKFMEVKLENKLLDFQKLILKHLVDSGRENMTFLYSYVFYCLRTSLPLSANIK